MDWLVFPLVRAGHSVGLFEAATGGSCHPIVADLRSDEALAVIAGAVSARTDRLEVLINNAGVPGASSTLEALNSRELTELLEVHCVGAVRCTKAVLPMLRAGLRPRVVNVTSRTASLARNAADEFVGETISYSYRIAKAAQNMLTLCMSDELAASGVVVCALHPGEFATALNPDGKESAAVAAKRIVPFVEELGPDDHGRWYDSRRRLMPW